MDPKESSFVPAQFTQPVFDGLISAIDHAVWSELRSQSATIAMMNVIKSEVSRFVVDIGLMQRVGVVINKPEETDQQ